MKKKENPLVTIGIPTYNRAGSYLKIALESALAQSYGNLEIIVSDNGSTDETEAVVASYGDPRICYHLQDPPLTPHDNGSFCLAKAKGEYFLLLHDDDIIDKDLVETCLAAAGKEEIGFVQTGARTIDDDGCVIRERPNPRSSEATLFDFCNEVIHGRAVSYLCNTFYDTECLKGIGGFRSEGFAYFDIIANVSLAHRHGWIDVREPKASYRLHDSKLGNFTQIEKWCIDSVALINLMRECLPRDEAYFRTEGMKQMCRRNFGKADKMLAMPGKLFAYREIMKRYRLKDLPVSFLVASMKRDFFGFFRGRESPTSG